MTTGDYLSGMKAVGIKQLKARLSEYVRLVKAGETILVTDRDEVVAELRPARRQRAPAIISRRSFRGLADSGEITQGEHAETRLDLAGQGPRVASGNGPEAPGRGAR